MIFSLNETERFLKKIHSLGECVTFSEYNGGNKFLVRHDVDLDLRLARDFAIMEQKIGIKATYFVLTGCATYNIFNKKNREYLKEIIELGHEVGLHFDPTLYTDEFMQEAAEKEADIMQFICGTQVKSISLHNPSLHGQYPELDGFVNAYNKKIFSDDMYISDSRYTFRGKNPFEFIERIVNTPIQVLLHPLHYTISGGGYNVVLSDWLDHFINDINNSFEGNDKFKSDVNGNLLAEYSAHLKK
jgi:hypothetical protein